MSTAGSGGAWMLDFRLFDLLGFVGMAGDANLLGAGLGQDNLAVFGRLMAGIA